MKTYKITFNDEIEANSEEEAYDKLLEWIKDCVEYGDVCAFDFEEVVK